MRALGIAALVWAVTACLRSGTSTCDDGRVCPEGTVCIVLGEGTGDPHRCVEPDQLGCTGSDVHASCDGGVCYAGESGGVCLPAGCANFLLDTNEQCDDGNNVPGDGCSADCSSSEQCGNQVIDVIAGERCDDGNALSRDGCASVCESEQAQWTLTRPGPIPSWHTDAAYDLTRRRIVMFSGQQNDDPVNFGDAPLPARDVWEFDGVAWILRNPASRPSGRLGHAMAYDGNRRRIVLFGGYASGYMNDTWEFDGTNWAALDTLPPPPRAFHRMVYDAKRKRVVMYGGEHEGVALGDTWEFDGNAWTQVMTSPAPAPRSHHVMAYDPERSVIVMAGGQANPLQPTNPMPTSDTWELDGTTWREVTGASFAFISSAAAFDPATDSVIAFGGYSGVPATSSDLTLRFTGQQWQALSVAGPPQAREGAVMLTDPVRDDVVMIGGYNRASIQIFTQVQRWDGATWTLLAQPQRPPPRADHAFVLDTSRRRGLLFGGFGTQYLGDTWVYEDDHWTLATTSPQPSPRTEMMVAYDERRDRVLLFGGQGASGQLGDTWLWNGSWSQVMPATSPSPRSVAAIAYDARRERVVMFGGRTEDGNVTDETWEWDGTTWTQRNVPGPGALGRMVMAYDPIREQVVLFGGQGTTGDHNETWVWNGTAWTNVSPVISPNPLNSASLTWSSARRRLVLFGGTGGAAWRDSTWEWDGTRWSEIIVDAPTTRAYHAAIEHPNGGSIFVLGGYAQSAATSGVTNDQVEFGYASTMPQEGCLDGSDHDGDGSSGCADPDCWPRCSPMCPPGVTCAPTAARCGDGTCSALENCRSCPGDCGACTPVCGDFICDPGETCVGDC